MMCHEGKIRTGQVDKTQRRENSKGKAQKHENKHFNIAREWAIC